MKRPGTLVYAIGNRSRGDDALGPMLLERLPIDLPDTERVEVYQLQIEHALDLQGRRRVLFVDAGHATAEPFDFAPVTPERTPTPFTHALTPGALLGVASRLDFPLPPAWVLCIRGDAFELGEPLSQGAEQRLASAQAFVQSWLATHPEHPHEKT